MKIHEYEFIGEVKFYDYRVNNFGYIIAYNLTSAFHNESIRVTEDSLVNEPNLYRDNSLIFFNIDSETKNPKDVVLIDSLIDEQITLEEVQSVVKKTIENIDFSELQSTCSRLNISIEDKMNKIFNILSIMKIDKEELKKYYSVIEKYFRIDESLSFFFKNDKNHFKNIILSIPDHISNLNDSQRILYITKTKNIKIINTLLKDWKFEDTDRTFELIKYLTENNFKSSVINGFINQLKKKIGDFSITEQFDLTDLLKEKDLVNKSINHWSFSSDDATTRLLNKIVEKEIDSSDIKKFIEELDSRFDSFNYELKLLIIEYINNIDFFLDKISSLENKLIKNDFDIVLDWIEERSSLFIEKKTIRLRLKKEILKFLNNDLIDHLKTFCERKSFSWLLKDEEILGLWSFEDIYGLESFTNFFFDSEISQISTEMDENITSILLDEVNHKSFELAMKWHEKLTDKLVPINMLYDYSINKINYQRALYGEKYLTINEDIIIQIVYDFEEKFDLNNDIKYKGLINFWMVIVCGSGANVELPDKPLMISWFQRDDIPEPLQLIFLKALIACSNSINPAGVDKLEVANYINEFPFTDLSSKLLMILIKNRKSTGIQEVATELNDAFYKSLTQNDENPYIGYSMKHCRKRTYRGGDIRYDSNKKTYSFNGAFYLVEANNSPDQYALEFNYPDNDYDNDSDYDDDLPF